MGKVKEKIKVLSRVRLEGKLKDNNGKFFACEFLRKDGSLRKMSCRTGVKKHLKGGKNNSQKDSNGLIVVWDREVEQYRTLNLETVISINMRGEKYRVK